MKPGSSRKLHMGCGEPLSALLRGVARSKALPEPEPKLMLPTGRGKRSKGKRL